MEQFNAMPDLAAGPRAVSSGRKGEGRRLGSLGDQGFLEYGTEKNALKQNGRHYDEVLVATDLVGKRSRGY
jgi:hypothetical protein